ncbi:hypothetical protein BCR32DRAFT_265558 [Anaeromyces robustus]|uniref:Uncharacterized protein n=1 Tax=Anaeromyces robustus TaxID=1754192 RepID=A0A1Y1XIM0_9FUNG|nr:hypothetical protein BCR32DRAFT_265558 [Anaeromyces robustus]|eukprot:ORX85605.1 hypothetical protein BCR32DRAFT_265558 [Anaeromyces robustus]
MVEKICIKSIDNAFQNWDDNPKDTAWLQKAEKYIKKLIDKKINQVPLFFYLGSVYLKQEKFNKAKKEFEKCVELASNSKLKQKYTLDVIITLMHIVNQKINNRSQNFEDECYEAIRLLQNLREFYGHYNFRVLQLVDFFYSKIIENGIQPENKDNLLVDLCFLLDIPEISLYFDLQFKILNSMKYLDFESCWVHIVKHSWDYRHNLNWNQFVQNYLDSFESTLWNEIYNKSQNKDLLKLEIWAEYLFALDNIARLYLENGEEAKEQLHRLKDAISNKIPTSEDKLISENSYAVKQEFMARYVKHNTIRVERIMRECKQSNEIWYSTIKESITYWKLCFAYQDSNLINELQKLDDKTVKASYREALLDDIQKKIKYSKMFNRNLSQMNSSTSLDQINDSNSDNNEKTSKLNNVNIENNEKISFQQSLGACERLSDSFYHLISFVLCYDLAWLKQPPIESSDKENQDLSEEEVILSSNSMNIPIIIDEQETRIFLFKDSHLDLIYNKLLQYDDFEDDFLFPLEHYFATDIYIIHDPWCLNKILNICMWHMYDGTFHKYLRYLFPTIPEYMNFSYLNSQNNVTLEDITCFFLILIIQRHIKCSHDKNFFKNNISVGQTFFLSVIQHPIASVSAKATKFWYSLIGNYGREKYRYMMTDIYSPEEIYKIVLEIRGEYNTYHKNILKDLWGLLGLNLMDIFMESELTDHSVEALHYMSLYLSLNKNNMNKSFSTKEIDPSSVLFDEIYDASEICGRDFYNYVLKKYKILKEKKCTRYETLVKNNKTLLNAYINDFDFLSDLEEGQGLMMTTTSPLAMQFNSEINGLTIDDDDNNDNNNNDNNNKDNDNNKDNINHDQKLSFGEGNETLIKSSLSNPSSGFTSPSPSISQSGKSNINGNTRLLRQMKILESMKQQQLNLNKNTNKEKEKGKNEENNDIINEKVKRKGKGNEKEEINNNNDNDNNNKNNQFFKSMRDSSDMIDNLINSSDSEASDNSNEDIIDRISKKQHQIQSQIPTSSLSEAISTFKSLSTSNSINNSSNESFTSPGLSRRVSRQLEKLNALRK